MNIFSKITSLFLVVTTLAIILAGCNSKTDDKQSTQLVDYVSQLKLDMNSGTVKQEVTVKAYIDGDTTHFYLREAINGSSIMKARYLAIDTPESTGKIEEWGKKAAAFTKDKLSSAKSIIVESDNATWNVDSTGERVLVWVWYKASDDAEYRNLNLEILQSGLAVASNSAQNRYGEKCMAAINQSKAAKLHVFSNDKDPDFPYGEATSITLKELRTNIEAYNGAKVSFTGIIVRDYGNSIYVEDYDAETDMYYGIMVYYGYNLSGDAFNIISVGNESKIVGTVQYYEQGGSYQISGIQYRAMAPDDPDNIQKISDGHSGSYRETDPSVFKNGTVNVLIGEESKIFSFAELALNTTISMKNLVVKSVSTYNNEESSSDGALTITCQAGDTTISIRTVPLYDSDGNLITEDYFKDKTIDVKGVVDYYNGTYQIKVFSVNDIIAK